MANNEKKYDFHFAGNLPETPLQIEIIDRQGQAEKLIEPQQFKLSVLIESINEYITKHPIDPKAASLAVIVASVDPDNPFIEYRENVNSPLGTILRADLKSHPDFNSWGINDELKFTMKDLVKHIRKYAHTFADVSQPAVLIQSLQNFEVKYEQLVAKEDDRQGKTKDIQETAIKFSKGELPKTLNLRLPLYRGTAMQDITVEIEIDKGQGNMPVFSFYSMDVEILARKVVDDTIKGEIEKFKDKFPILYV